MEPLAKPLRSKLENTVKAARGLAEVAARMLPQVFRPDSSALTLGGLAPERKPTPE